LRPVGRILSALKKLLALAAALALSTSSFKAPPANGCAGRVDLPENGRAYGAARDRDG